MSGYDSVKATIENGYVGWCSTKREQRFHVDLLRSHGLKAWTKGWSIWTEPETCLKAREIRRGFRVGMRLIGNPFDFMLGMRSALLLGVKKKAPELSGQFLLETGERHEKRTTNVQRVLL